MRKGIGSVLSFVLLAGPAFSACSKQPFTVGKVKSELAAPGTFSVPAKVDVLIAQDNTSSMYEALGAIQAQVPGFMTQLQNSGWDYRLAVTPLAHYENPDSLRELDEIVGSRFDANWLMFNQWWEPFPGVDPSSLNNIMPQFFRTPANFGGYMTTADILPFLNSQENGFKTIQRTLFEKSPVSQFLRPDAMLAVIVIGNGNDTSDVNMCLTVGNNSQYIPCGEPGTQPGQMYLDNRAATFDKYRNDFLSLVSSGQTAKIQFHSIVAFNNEWGCVASNDHAYRGYRYLDMALALDGTQSDICSLPINSALTALNDDLQATKTSFVTKYLVLGYEPDPSQIQVTKLIGGDPDNAVVIPQNATNGWTYIGGPQTLNTVIYPIPMNQQTGWVIELNGTGLFHGNDVPVIVAPPADGTPSN